VRHQFILQKTKGGSQIPFYNLAFLGGREYVRGFRDYRFRANNMLMFSAELRQTLWAMKEDRGIDVFVFGDTGQVWGDNRSQINPVIIANQSFDSSNWRSGFGGGFQYRHSKGLAARLELGHSNERNLIYFSLSRGF
jgi:hemolysin activation/secretion protein